MRGFRRQPHVPFSPVTWFVSPALFSLSGCPLAPAREHGSRPRLGERALGQQWVCRLPGAVPSAERAVCPSGEEQSGGGLYLFLFYAEFRAQPSSQPLSSSVYFLSILFLGPGAPRPLGYPPAPGLLPAVPRLSILKMPPLGQPPPSQCF